MAVVGDVDSGRLVKRLAKVGKIAEVIVQPPPEGEKKKSDGGDKIGNKASPANGKGSDGGSSGNAKHGADGYCPPKGACADATKNDVKLSDNGNGNGGAVGNGQQEGSRAGTAPIGVSEDYHVKATMCYHRAEPAMAVPVHLPYYEANCTVPPPPYGIGGCYCAMPPPPPPHCRRPPVVRPQPTRFVDEGLFNDDDTVGCHVM